MARYYEIKPSFAAGEISSTMKGRVDLETYQKSLLKARNVYVDAQGWIKRREGMEYVDSTTNDDEARLIPFSFSTVQSYLLVFTPGEFKVYKDGVLQATVSSSPISGLSADEIQEMDYTQSADTLILVHPDVAPIEITRTSDTSWSASNIAFDMIPYFPFSGVTESNPSANVSYSTTTGRVNLTFSASVTVETGQFIVFDKGGTIRIDDGVTSGTSASGFFVVDAPDDTTVNSGDWIYESGYEEVWSATQGWPRSVTFYQNRLYFGGSKSLPNFVWGSQIGDYFNFAFGDGLDDEAVEVQVVDDQVNAIQFLFAGRTLQVYTQGGEYYVPNLLNEPITPSNFTIANASRHGVAKVKPVSLDGATAFVEGGNNVMRHFVYTEREQSFQSVHLSILSSHLVQGVTRMAVRNAVDHDATTYCYIVNGDGNVAVLNSLREQTLRAYTLFETDGTVEDVAAVNKRDVYFVVKRNIGGSDVRFIERLDKDRLLDASQADTSGTATNSWSGFGHLNGETVKVIGDGYILEDEEVSSGSITSSLEVSEIELGLEFLAEMETMPLDGYATDVPNHGEPKRPVYANVQLYESQNIRLTSNGISYEPSFREFGDNKLDQPVELFSGWKERIFLQGRGLEQTVTITQPEPLNFNVLSVNIKVA